MTIFMSYLLFLGAGRGPRDALPLSPCYRVPWAPSKYHAAATPSRMEFTKLKAESISALGFVL